MQSLEHRIPPPLVFLITAIVMGIVARLTPTTGALGKWQYELAALLAMTGLSFAAPAIAAFGRAKTTVNPIKIDTASTLVTSGIYSLTRNPMYVGLTALLLAWVIILAAPWALLGPAGFVLFITRFQIIPEERAMTGLFGPQYQAYRLRTRRWL